MQVKFLKFIVEKLVGKSATPIIDLLFDKKDVNEFIIAKKLGLTINQTRNILYHLSDSGLVSFIRKKDKKKGWYIYFWTLNLYQSLSFLEQNLKKELEALEMQLKGRKEKRFYVCKTCSIEVSEETALLNDFVCPECEEVYSLAESPEIIRQLEKSISKIKKEIELVSTERKIEEKKLQKKKIGKINRIEKKRTKEKLKKRIADKKEKIRQEKKVKRAAKKISSRKKIKSK